MGMAVFMNTVEEAQGEVREEGDEDRGWPGWLPARVASGSVEKALAAPSLASRGLPVPLTPALTSVL